MRLGTFERKLEKLIERPTHVRPFVCIGSPLKCTAFIVGFNPATKVSQDFWNFWSSGYGFDKSAWFEAYKSERSNLPRNPDGSQPPVISRTRTAIELALAEASPVPCLETNIHSASSKEASALPKYMRSTAVFDFLLASIAPRLIVTHGKDAEEHVKAQRLEAVVISYKHFSRCSYELAQSAGRAIRDRSISGWV